AFVLAGLVHAGRERRAGVIRGVLWGAALAAACAGSAGWFILRNQSLYGRLTGRGAATGDPSGTWKAHKQTWPGSSWNYLTEPHNYWGILQSMYGDLINTKDIIPWSRQLFDVTLGAIWITAGVGFIMWLGGWQRLRRDGPTVLFIAAILATTFGGMVWFVGVGSYPHPRYLFAALPIGAALLARAVSTVPLGRFLLPLAIVAQAVCATVYLAILPAQRVRRGFLHAFPDAIRAAGFGTPDALTVGLLCAAAIGILVCCACTLRLSFPLPTGSRVTGLPAAARWVSVRVSDEPAGHPSR
ncbi:MAG TPA: hypothetical protein VHC49_07730, partial [Mycobacteriales bacterium]|nr:hypothetical protein [Mycobacteriales bacterium]